MIYIYHILSAQCIARVENHCFRSGHSKVDFRVALWDIGDNQEDRTSGPARPTNYNLQVIQGIVKYRKPKGLV